MQQSDFAQTELMHELEHALKVSYEHPWLRIQRMLAKRNQLEIVVSKHEESSLKQFKYLIKRQEYNYNAKVKLINVFDLPGSH